MQGLLERSGKVLKMLLLCPLLRRFGAEHASHVCLICLRTRL